MDRLGQFLGLRGAPDVRASSISASSCSATRLTGPSRSRSAVSRSSCADFGVRVAHLVGVEAELLGQALRHAFEASRRRPAHIPRCAPAALRPAPPPPPGVSRAAVKRLVALERLRRSLGQPALGVLLGRRGLGDGRLVAGDRQLQLVDLGAQPLGIAVAARRARPPGSSAVRSPAAAAPRRRFAACAIRPARERRRHGVRGRRRFRAPGSRLRRACRRPPPPPRRQRRALPPAHAPAPPGRAVLQAPFSARASRPRPPRQRPATDRRAARQARCAAPPAARSRRPRCRRPASASRASCSACGRRQARRFPDGAELLDLLDRRVALLLSLRRARLPAPAARAPAPPAGSTRISRSAAAAPLPVETKPSQRRNWPSRVTSLWPTASILPVVDIAHADLAQPPLELGRSLDMIGQRGQPLRQGGSSGEAALPCQRRGASPPIAASTSSPSAAASARS